MFAPGSPRVAFKMRSQSTVNFSVSDAVTGDEQDHTPRVRAKACVVYDAYADRTIYAKSAHVRMQIASLTKIMTCIVVVDVARRHGLDLETLHVRVSRAAAEMRGTSACLREKDVLTALDVLHALMLPSGNDAAVCLAENFGALLYHETKGTASDAFLRRPAPQNDAQQCLFYDFQRELDVVRKCSHLCFVKEMNKRAQALGLSAETHFSNAHGLCDKSNYSCAADIVRLSRVALGEPLLKDLVAVVEYTCTVTGANGAAREMCWHNTNKLLDIGGFQGLKTGFTNAAGGCLASYFSLMDFTIYEKLEYIIVVLGCDGDGDGGGGDERFEDTLRVVDWVNNQLYERNGKKYTPLQQQWKVSDTKK